MTEREHLHLILYELSLSIGNSDELMEMLEQALSSYLRKLNCFAAGVLELQQDDDGYRTFGLLHAIPRTFGDSKLYKQISSRIPALDNNSIWQRFRQSLPIRQQCIDSTFYLMALGERNLLFLASKHEALDITLVRSLSPLNDKLSAAIDACEQRRALLASEAKAKDEQNRLKTFMETVQAGILVLDARTHEIIEANTAALRMIETTKEQLIGNICNNLICTHSPGECPVTDLGQTIENAEQVLLTTTGHSIPVLRTVNRFVLAGRDLLIESMVDISAQKQIEEQLRSAKKAAEAASEAKSDFLANVSHEIRTPMTAILGFTDLLLDDLDQHELPEHKLKAARTIRKNGRHLLNLINDILDLSKIDSGTFIIDSVPCSPKIIIADVVSLFEVRTRSKGLAFVVETDNNIPDTIVTDPMRLRQILINILGNAVKFTEIGSITLKSTFERDDEGGGELMFRVVDTGIGMTPSQAKMLFRPFTQVDTSSARRFGGTGLGLVISKRLAKTLGGDVDLEETAPEKGSTFSIRISSMKRAGVMSSSDVCASPRTAYVEPTDIFADPSVPTHLGDQPLCDTVILLAEDGEDNQDYFSHVLRKAGAIVDVVGNGQLAVDAVLGAPVGGTNRGIAKYYDVILMDMQMPIVDGYQATRILREHDYRGTIIALTAHAMTGDRTKCINIGCNDYLTKPINRRDLCQAIQRHIPARVSVNS